MDKLKEILNMLNEGNTQSAEMLAMEALLAEKEKTIQQLQAENLSLLTALTTAQNTAPKNTTFIDPKGDKWEGNIINGKLQGWGKVTRAEDGQIQEGFFDDKGWLRGLGKVTFADDDGTILEGYFVEDQLSFGKHTKDDGTVMEGTWKYTADEGISLNGWGRVTFATGEIQEGHFEEGNLNGWGKRTFADGTILEGYFEENDLNGWGKRTLDDGCVFEGHFEENDFNGWGKITLGDGRVFEGHFENKNLNGWGKRTFDDGTVLEGHFEQDELNGLGKKTVPSGECRTEEGFIKTANRTATCALLTHATN